MRYYPALFRYRQHERRVLRRWRRVLAAVVVGVLLVVGLQFDW